MALTEVNTGRPDHKPGIYRHPVSKSELVARRHPKFGDVQADALVHAGYEWVGPEVKDAPKKAEASKTSEK
jgi:hypothetical protein